MLVACWNVAFHRRTNWRGIAIAEHIENQGAEVACLPESFEHFLADGWHGITSAADYGYPQLAGRRKVTLWSRQPWFDVDPVGAAALPSGRFVAGTTTTSLGPVRIIGLCVPWRAAHVSTGRKDRRPWEDHTTFLRVLGEMNRPRDDLATLVIGDFNQTVPNRRAPKEAEHLLASYLSDINIWTSSPDGLDRSPVCHIGGSAHFAAEQVFGLSAKTERGDLSDHDGLFAEVVAAPSNA